MPRPMSLLKKAKTMSNDPRLPDLAEATRLTQAGRLQEATALIQGLLRGEKPAPAGPAARTIDAAAETIEVTDRPAAAAPTPEAGGWRMPEGLRDLAGKFRATGGVEGRATPARDAAPVGGWRMPEGLRDLVDKFGRGAGNIGDVEGWARPAPTPDVVPVGGRWIAGSYADGAGTRGYKLYVPSGYKGEPVPLIVMLHGCTQSPDDFAAGTRMNALAEERTCLVVYPAQDASANMQRCWNWFSATDQGRDRGEPSLIAGIARKVMGEYAVDPRRVYVAGLSAGGAAAAIVGAAYPDLFAAVGVHSGLPVGAASDMPSAFAAMRQGPGGASPVPVGRPVPTIVFHGDRDTTVHPANGDRVVTQAAAGAVLRTTVENGEVPGGHAYRRTVHADAAGGTLVEQWVVRTAGHAWSGGGAGSYTDPKGPDASREMLRFFLEHPRPATA